MAGIYVGIDLGGTKTLVAAADIKGDIIRKKRENTPPGLREGLVMLKNMVREIRENDKIISIGCACGGPLNHKKGIISPVHQPQWRLTPIKEIMEKEFGCPFYVDVDTNVAALGEYRFGEGKKYGTFVYIVIGTGMGGAIFSNNRLHRGKDNGHTEIGHQSSRWKLDMRSKGYDMKKHSCACGVPDCLEGVVSGDAIRKIYGKPAENLNRKEWEEVGYNLGQGLRNVVALHAPDAILLFGGVACGGGDKLLGPAKKVVEEYVKIVPKPVIKISSLGYEASLKGSIALAMEGEKI